MLGVVEVIESQFGITYPPPTLPAVPWLRHNPTLMNFAVVILKIVEEHTKDGPRNCIHLRLWLGLMGNFNYDAIILSDLLEDHTILKELYIRGIIDYSPPRLCIAQPFREVQYMLILRGRRWPEPHPHMQPMRVLIINAGGVQHPDFPVAFAQLNDQHNPHLVVVTETRVGGAEGGHKRLSMNFQESLFLDPAGFLGGMWLFWNSNLLTSQLMYQNDKSLSVELTLRD
ncbi:hypothetical protein COLO4_03881 [Corchorus olitorius]|uniref:Uncharacterized protein n=1 Tax=Corchorus olitorius TaxID=93759 RepID=A0A1R3KWB4_9ROSI|nr:hypothetical protein COLO4_03881 [Corchorus olitorius]